MSSELFAGMPGINIPRSRWKNGYNLPSTFKHGFLIPCDFIPIVPGDGANLNLRDLTRMQTPIAPIFGNIKEHFAAFFVPMRLVWEHTEEFFGANKTSAGPQTGNYAIPVADFSEITVGSVSHYLGKPLKATADVDADGNNKMRVSILKERCYYLIWNEYFRAQQITNPVIISKGDNASFNEYVGSWNGNNIFPGSSNSLMKVAKEFDYFTACTISPQYGNAVSLPLGTTAPIITSSTIHTMGSSGLYLSNSTSAPTGPVALGIQTGSGKVSYESSAGTGVYGTNVTHSNLYADLSNATAAKINDIRYAFAVQKYLERANFAGNYFFGILQVHYGITSPDSRLQRPEFLGEFSEDILVHQVVATADTVNSGVRTSVGNTGAMSVTASGDVHLFDKAFVEPGFLCIVKWTRARHLYSQGIMREDMKSDRFEIYTPELCNLGDQATKTKEIYWKARASDIFGYQEHWAEYRYRPDRVSGMLDPNGANSLDFWTLADKFTSKPTLNDTFIMEQRDLLDRALTTGSSVDEYISDTWINIIWTREMPVRTMPGLIDHFGAM